MSVTNSDFLTQLPEKGWEQPDEEDNSFWRGEAEGFKLALYADFDGVDSPLLQIVGKSVGFPWTEPHTPTPKEALSYIRLKGVS